MIQAILVILLFLGAMGWMGKRFYDQVHYKKSPGCAKCGQPSAHKP